MQPPAGRRDYRILVQRAARFGHHFGNISLFPPGGDARPAQAADGTLAQRIRSSLGQGQPLDASVQSRLESGMGTDLPGIRVHTDREADRLAASVDAIAFTTGPDIFFRHGAYDPRSTGGMRVLAHEAAHVIQQATGVVSGVAGPDGTVLSQPGDRFEREAEARAAQWSERAMAPGSAAPQLSEQVPDREPPGPSRARPGAIIIQRLQNKPIQRITVGQAAINNNQNRVQVVLTVEYQDGTSETITMHCSHQRHLVHSYFATYNTTTTPFQTTLCLATQDDFLAAFQEYAGEVANLIQQQRINYVPNDAANNLDTTRNISFHSDRHYLGADIHCFPTRRGNRSRELDPDDFDAFKHIARFLVAPSAHVAITDTIRARAADGWGRINANADLRAWLLECLAFEHMPAGAVALLDQNRQQVEQERQQREAARVAQQQARAARRAQARGANQAAFQ